MNDIEKRLANTEAALVGLWALLQDILPPASQEETERYMRDYFDTNEALGGFKRDSDIFIK